MRVVVFFVYLCILLLNGSDSIYATTTHQNNSSYLLAQRNNTKTRQVQVININKGYTVNSLINLAKGDERFITEDVEDGNNSFVRKYKSLSRYYLALSCPLVLNDFHSRSKAPELFSSRLSYKYITQRVLRI